MAVPDDLPNVTGSTDDVILICDAGTVASWYARDLKLRRGMMGSLSGGLATTAAPSTLARASKLPDLAQGGHGGARHHLQGVILMNNTTASNSRAWRTGLAAIAVAAAGAFVSPAALAAHFVGAVVTVQPPAPQVEVVGVAPHPGWIWESGYWNWEGGRHVWHGGRWEAPRPGYYWEPHVWVHEGGGWRMREGYWARR